MSKGAKRNADLLTIVIFELPYLAFPPKIALYHCPTFHDFLIIAVHAIGVRGQNKRTTKKQLKPISTDLIIT